jgi:dienelactone hydrolase
MMLFRLVPILPLLPALLMAQPAQDPTALSRKALDLFLSADYSALTAMFTVDMKKDLTEDKLAKLGAQIKTMGAVEKIGDPMARKAGANTIVVFPVKFAAESINFQWAINASGLVASMVELPGAVDWKRPDYSKPDSFKEREVTVGEGEWKLPGTLTVPVGSGKFPGVLLVHGSGPNDRDETVGRATKVFKDLAEGLASRGVVVLRYEKRTKEYGARMAGIAKFTVAEEIVEDATKAVALLRAQPEVDPRRIYVLGHSIGGYVAPRIAEEDGKLAGLVILAGNVRPMEDLAVEQAEYVGITGKQLDAARAMQAKVKALDAGDLDGPRIMGEPVAYWVDLKGYDPAAQAKRLGLPMLILQGERDFQVSMKDFALWKAAAGSNKGVTMKSFPGLNHLFVAGEGKSSAIEYGRPGHVAAEVIDAVAKFVSQ